MLGYFSNEEGIMKILFNADTLYLPALYKDIIIQNSSFADWNLTPAPYLFPDITLYFISFYFAIAVMAVIQLLLLWFGIYIIFKFFYSSNKAVLIASLVLAVICIVKPSLYYLTISSAHHFGQFLVGLYVIYFILKSLRENLIIWKNVLLSILIIFTVASDKLFILNFLLPLFITLSLLLTLRKISIKTWAIYTIGFILQIGLGFYLQNLLVHNEVEYDVFLTLNNIEINIEIMFNNFHRYFVSDPLLFLFFCVSNIVVLFFFIIGVITNNRFKSLRKSNISFDFIATFLMVLLGSTFIINLGLSIVPTERYWFASILLVGVFSIPYFELVFKNSNVKFDNVLSIGSVLLLLFGVFQIVKTYDFYNLKNEYYPEEIACLDNYIEETNSKTGIAQYWQAKWLFVLSKRDVIIASKNRDLTDRKLITSLNWYKEKYDFALVDNDAIEYYRLQKDRILQNEKASFSKFCNKTEFLYFEDGLILKPFAKINQPITWRAIDLWSKTGKQVGDYIQAIPQRDAIGHQLYGPSVSIPEGKFEFNIEYSSESSKEIEVIYWDILVSLPNQEPVLINKGMLYGTNKKTIVFNQEFEILEEHKNWNVEIRSKFLGNGEVTLNKLTIQKIE